MQDVSINIFIKNSNSSLRKRSRSNPNKIDCHASKEARNDNKNFLTTIK